MLATPAALLAATLRVAEARIQNPAVSSRAFPGLLTDRTETERLAPMVRVAAARG